MGGSPFANSPNQVSRREDRGIQDGDDQARDGFDDRRGRERPHPAVRALAERTNDTAGQEASVCQEHRLVVSLPEGST